MSWYLVEHRDKFLFTFTLRNGNSIYQGSQNLIFATIDYSLFYFSDYNTFSLLLNVKVKLTLCLN